MVASASKLFLPAKGVLSANNAGLLLGTLSGKNTRPGVFAAWGTFGGGTIKLQIGFTVDGVTYQFFDTGASFTAAGYTTFNLAGDVLQLVLSGATTPTLNYVVE